MNILDYLKENFIYLDGGTGTLLQSAGLPSGELPERWNITHPEVIRDIHKEYFDAGSNVVCTNTFGANLLKFSSDELRGIISSAVENAKEAMRLSSSEKEKWIALDVGPLGKMLKPIGDLDFEDAVSIFAETIRIGVECGVDLIFVETMNDCYETKAALLAAKENCSLPVFVSNAYGEDGKLMTGASPLAMIAMLEGMGADAIGVNCSLGPRMLMPVVEQYIEYSSLPVIVKPNAGLPRLCEGITEYDLSPLDFGKQLAEMMTGGARVVGGCCGTTPEYIASLCRLSKDLTPRAIEKKSHKIISSYTRGVIFGERPILVGERINPTGKPKFKEALRLGDMEYILREALNQESSGADVLDVNVGLPGIDEIQLLTDAVCAIQSVCDLPLQIDSANVDALESSLRRYNGKAMINSVNGKVSSMEKIFPLAKKYGGVLVCLTLDENGIPTTAEGRLAVAKKIYNEAKKYGIDPKNLIFDPLAMAVSADKNAARETLRAVKLISEELGCHTSLGVSNISFGLPRRELINSAFFTMALENGLSAAIMNPDSEDMMQAFHSYLALSGLDNNFDEYVAMVTENKREEKAEISSLHSAIVKGMKDQAARLAKELLSSTEPLKIIDEEIAPALNEVGDGFEKKTVYLPGLLMAAESAGAAFEVIKSAMPREHSIAKATVVIATVKGDIHDIGKNIVKLILENYGYSVVDLGKDVSPERILSAVQDCNAEFVALSALMTTTLPAMEETVNLLRENTPNAKIMVGGAVLNSEYAKSIGADFYGEDAMAAVKYLENIFN